MKKAAMKPPSALAISLGETVLKGIMLEASKPWTASLRQRDETHDSPGGQAHPPAEGKAIRN